MNDRSILERYRTRTMDIGQSSADLDAIDDLGAFGWLRGIRERALFLELRRRDGNILAVGYGYMDRIEFDPSEGVTLSVAGQKIRIRGGNLNAEVRSGVRLFEGITRHRVTWLRETSEFGPRLAPRQSGAAQPTGDQAFPHIERIEW